MLNEEDEAYKKRRLIFFSADFLCFLLPVVLGEFPSGS